MPVPGHVSAQPSKVVANKLALIKAKVTDNGFDSVQVLLGELQNALQEVEERKRIEVTLKQQVKVYEPASFSLGGAMELQNNNVEARKIRSDNCSALEALHEEFSRALDEIENDNPGLDTSSLASIALKLGVLKKKVVRFEFYIDANAETQLNHQKKRTAIHRNRAAVPRTERDIAQTALAAIQRTALETLANVHNLDEFKSLEAKPSLDGTTAIALVELQALGAHLETAMEPIEPRDEDDAADAAEDENTQPKFNTYRLDQVLDSFRKTIEHTITIGKILRTLPAILQYAERPSKTVFAVMRGADKRAWDGEAKAKAKTAELALATKTLEADLCNQKLEQSQANGTIQTNADEIIMSAYLEMAKSNIASGQILIDRIGCLECCIGDGETNSKCKRACDGYHTGVSPEVLQALIQRLTDEIPPQADLVAKIRELLTILRARLEQRVRDVSPQKKLSSGLQDEEDEMSNTGDLDAHALLQINMANVRNGETLINRIAELESELHTYRAHSSGALGGDEDCLRKLEEAKKQIQILTNRLAELEAEFQGPQLRDLINSRVADLESQLDDLNSQSEEQARSAAGEDCPREYEQAMKQNQDLINKIADLESELHTLKSHSPVVSGGDKDCPNELEKAKKQLKYLAAALKSKQDELEELTNRLCTDFAEYLDEEFESANPTHSRIKEVKDQIAALRAQVEKLKKEKFEVERRRDICYNYNLDILEPTVTVLKQEIRRLNHEIIDRKIDKIHKETLLEERMKLLAELDAYRLGETVVWGAERDMDWETWKYQAILAKNLDLRNRLKICEEARGNTVEEEESGSDVDESGSDGEDEEEHHALLRFYENLSRNQLIKLLARRTFFQAQVAFLIDQRDLMMQSDQLRQRGWIEENAQLRVKHASKMSDKDEAFRVQNEKVASLKADLASLKIKLQNCREFRDNVLKLGIEEPEEPHDLEGLDSEALIEEIVELQRRLKALGIKYEEAVRNDQTFVSDSELDEDLEFQNPRQQIRDLKETLGEVRAMLEKCKKEHEMKVDNPEEAESMAVLKRGVQKIRDEREDATDKLEKCEEEVDRLIKLLQAQVAVRQRDLDTDKGIAKEQAQKEAGYRGTIWELTEKLSSSEIAHEAMVKKFNNLLAQANKDLSVCLETRETDTQGTACLKERVKVRCEEIERLEAELAGQDRPVPEQVQSLKDQVARLKKELADRKKHATTNGEHIDALNEDLDHCQEEKDKLQEQLVTQKQKCEAEKAALRQKLQYFVEKANTAEGTDAISQRVEELQDQLAQVEAEPEAEKKRAESSRKAANKNFESWQEERLKKTKCEEKLADLNAQYPSTGLRSRKRPAPNQPDENLEDCVAEVARLRHKVAGLEVEITRLTKQVKAYEEEDDGSDDDDDEDVKKYTQQQGNASDGAGEDSPLPMDDNDLDPHRAYNEEIEALNNQIITQKERITALEQQAANDTLQIDALNHSNTDKSQKYQKFSALIDKLKAELEDLQTRLFECKLFVPQIYRNMLICVGAFETWQERRARMRSLAAANRGPRGPSVHRIDPALAQIEEWNRSGWWRSERDRPEKRRRTK
jgi:chromosome segregation ATPase